MLYRRLVLFFPRVQIRSDTDQLVNQLISGWLLLREGLSFLNKFKCRDFFFFAVGENGKFVDFIFWVPELLAENFANLLEASLKDVEVEISNEAIRKNLILDKFKHWRGWIWSFKDKEKPLLTMWNLLWQLKTNVGVRVYKSILDVHIKLFLKDRSIRVLRRVVRLVLKNVKDVASDCCSSIAKYKKLSLMYLPIGDLELVAKRYSNYKIPKANENDLELGDDSRVLLGKTVSRKQQEKFIFLPEEIRARHFYLVGKTGVGKSNFLLGKILADIKTNQGLAVMDPHGDLIDEILIRIPKSRIKDVVYFDPANLSGQIPINLFKVGDVMSPDLIVSNLIAVFKRQFGYSWGPRLEYILRFSLLTLVELECFDLNLLLRLLTDEKYLKENCRTLKNEKLKNFWNQEFLSIPKSKRAEWVAPILNKVGQVLSIPKIDRILTGNETKFLPRRFMDEGKIVLCRLAKGELGDDVIQFLGAMLVSMFQLAAMSRVDIKEVHRRPFTLYADEFQNFATDSFAMILSEARKYKLRLVLAHQYLEQLEPSLLSAVLGNVGSVMAFRTGADDAARLKRLFTEIDVDSFVKLPRFMAYASLYSREGPKLLLLKTLPVKQPGSEKRKLNTVNQSWQFYK